VGVRPESSRFVDQPVIRALEWSEEKRRRIQARVEAIHRSWTGDGDYLAPPSRGKLVAIDPVLRVKPPKGMKVGYVPIVTAQRPRDGASPR
jgi:hypothetical protein